MITVEFGYVTLHMPQVYGAGIKPMTFQGLFLMRDYTTKLKRSVLVREFYFQSKILCYCVFMV